MNGDNITSIEEKKEEIKNAATEEKKLTDPTEQVKRLASGELLLENPIKSGAQSYDKISYDFRKITGWDYADAMDSDSKNSNLFWITAKQALSLFAVAASKATPGMSSMDVKEQIGMGDTMNAVRIATAFFIASTRAGNMRISNA